MRQREFNALQKFPFSLQSDKEDGIRKIITFGKI